MTGMLIKNTARHPNPSTSSAPSVGPAVAAMRRRTPDPDRHLVPGGRVAARTRARPDGACNAPPVAWTIRAPISISPDTAKPAHRTEQEDRYASQEDPFVAVALRGQPPIRRRLATPMLQALKIQPSADSDVSENWSRISGKAREMTVISMLTMKTAAEEILTRQPSRPTGGSRSSRRTLEAPR